MPTDKKSVGLPSLPSLWAMHPDAFVQMWSRLTPSLDALTAYWDWDEEDAEPAKPYTIKDGIARLDVKGPLVKEGGFWTWWLGGTSLNNFASLCEAVGSDEEVTEVLVVFDSPGGTLDGTGFAAEALRRLTGKKTVKGHVNGCCCSAAYWLACAIPKGSLTSNPESDVANIGIYTTVTDVSKMLSEEGIERKLYATGKYKGAGVWGIAVSAAHDEQFQSLVEAPFALFQNVVKEGRGLPTKTLKQVSEGFVYMASDAVDLGLIDRVGYMQNGVPPCAEMPTTTEDGTPPAPPSDDAEEQTRMNDEEQKSLFQKFTAWLHGNQTPTIGGVTTESVNHGSQTEDPLATALAAKRKAEDALLALGEQLKQAKAEANASAVDRYIALGILTPGERESALTDRAENPAFYDRILEKRGTHPAMGGGETTEAEAGTVDALTRLRQARAQAQGEEEIAPAVKAYLEQQEKKASNGNAITKLRGGR